MSSIFGSLLFRVIAELMSKIKSSQPGVSGSFTPDAYNQMIIDSSSFSVTLDSGSRNAIQWIAAKDRILIGTTGGEWRMSGHSNKPLTPTNYDLKPQTVWGSKDMQPLVLHESVMFVDYVGRKLRELVWDGTEERYKSPDLMLLAEHITLSGGITTMAYQRNPDSIIWATLANGELISCTYDKEQDVVAWARHPMPQGNEADSATETEGYSIVPEYPTLQELTAAEIPTIPDEPSVTPSATAVSNSTLLQAMTGSGKYYLTNDIDLTGVTWTPIATTASGFVLDGKGYTISNLTISAPTSDYQGLFGTLAEGCQIYDINFSNCSVTGDANVGILFGRKTVAGTLTLKNITFDRCVVTAAGYDAGIMCGLLDNLTGGAIYNCNVKDSTVIGYGWSVGGMAGSIYLSSTPAAIFYVTNCTVENGTVTSTSKGYIGGLVGETEGDNSYSINYHSCWSSSTILAPVTGATTGAVGGLFGDTVDVVVVSCYSTGNVTINCSDETTTFVGAGGFSGEELCYETRGSTFINCYSTGSIIMTMTDTSLEEVGGFIGKCDVGATTNILRCYSTGNITITRTGSRTWMAIGGFLGFAGQSSALNSPAQITRCWSTGDVYLDSEIEPVMQFINGAYVCGGGLSSFIGQVEFNANSTNTMLNIENCYAWGSITTGEADDSTTRGALIGDIVYDYDKPDITITNIYTAQTDTAAGSGYTNQITEGTYSGGLIGWLYEDETGYGTITDVYSFWDNETSEITVSPSNFPTEVGTSQTTDWLQTKANFEAVDWDFDTIWYMPTPVFWKNATNSNGLGANSVTVIPGTTEDEIWISIGRVIGGERVGYIERMAPRNWGTDQEDCFFVDSGLTYDGDATTTFTGLEHLEGETVAILGDGAVFPTQTVTDGTVTLPEAVSVCHIGLPFTYKLKPMRFDQAYNGTSKGLVKKITNFTVSFYKTLGARYGDGTNYRDFKWRETTDPYTTAPVLFTGDKNETFDGGFSAEDPVEITGSDPLPCTVRCIIPRIEVTGK